MPTLELDQLHPKLPSMNYKERRHWVLVDICAVSSKARQDEYYP